MSTLPCRSSPPQPPHAPGRALHSPGFPSGQGSARQLSGTGADLREQGVSPAADQIAGRARLSGHCAGAQPRPRHAAPNALQMWGTKMGTQLHLPPRGGGPEAPPEELHRRKGLHTPSPARLALIRGRDLVKTILATLLASYTAERCLPR